MVAYPFQNIVFCPAVRADLLVWLTCWKRTGQFYKQIRVQDSLDAVFTERPFVHYVDSQLWLLAINSSGTDLWFMHEIMVNWFIVISSNPQKQNINICSIDLLQHVYLLSCLWYGLIPISIIIWYGFLSASPDKQSLSCSSYEGAALFSLKAMLS